MNSQRPIPRSSGAQSRRHLRVALAAMSCCAGLAACAGSTATMGGTATGSGSVNASALKVSECMRAHGVPNFPDPTEGAGGDGLSVSESPGSSAVTVAGVAFSGPAFVTAAKTCHFGPGGGPRPAVSESQKQALVRFAQCMRAHGVPGFADPRFPSGGGIEQSRPAPSPTVASAAVLCNESAGTNRRGG